MHAATVFGAMRSEKFNVLSFLDGETKQVVRRVAIHTILGTDMKHHFNLISKLQTAKNMFPQAAAEGELQMPYFVEDTSHIRRIEYLGGKEGNEGGQRMLMLEAILHAADISNPARPLRTCKMWAERVMNEFYDQGDKEKEKGLPVTFDRASEKTCLWRVQFNFIKFIVAPLYVEIVGWFPSTMELGDRVVSNHAHWLQQGLTKILKKEQAGDVASLQAQHDDIKGKFDAIVDAMSESGWYSVSDGIV